MEAFPSILPPSRKFLLIDRLNFEIRLVNKKLTCGLDGLAQATSAFQLKHSEAFPNKVCLQLKIREVRQKMMARSASPTATTASGNSAASAPGTPLGTPTMPNNAVAPPPHKVVRLLGGRGGVDA